MSISIARPIILKSQEEKLEIKKQKPMREIEKYREREKNNHLKTLYNYQ